MKRDHLCGCRTCDPTLNRGDERCCADHVAVRFGDRAFDVYADGVKLPYVTEAHGGPYAWRTEFRQPLHACRWCGEHACERLLAGPCVIAPSDPDGYASWRAIVEHAIGARDEGYQPERILELMEAAAARVIAHERAGLFA